MAHRQTIIRKLYFGIPQRYFDINKKAYGPRWGMKYLKMIALFPACAMGSMVILVIEMALASLVYGLVFGKQLVWMFIMISARLPFTLPTPEANFVATLYITWLISTFLLPPAGMLYISWKHPGRNSALTFAKDMLNEHRKIRRENKKH